MADHLAEPGDPGSALTLSPPPEPAELTPRRTWGAWASVGWTFLVTLLIGATQTIIAVACMIVSKLASSRTNLNEFAADGSVLAIANLVKALVGFVSIALLIGVRGGRIGDYLALRPATGRVILLSLSGFIIWMAFLDGLTITLNRPIVLPLPLEAVFSTPLWLLTLVAVVALPIIEEVVFRGFLYRGLAESSQFGPGIAIGLAAFGWACFHIPDNLFALASLYLTGLYLGAVRYYSGSLILTIFLHAFFNTVATALAVRFAG